MLFSGVEDNPIPLKGFSNQQIWFLMNMGIIQSFSLKSRIVESQGCCNEALVVRGKG